MADEDDEPLRDEPYSNSDLLKPGFDPFEAHREWIARRQFNYPTPAQQQARQDAAIARIKAAVQADAEERAKRPKRKKKRNYVKTSKRDESAESVKMWKEALADIQQKRGK